MPQKGFRDDFFQVTRYNREFTFGRMCRDFFGIVTFMKIVFVLMIYSIHMLMEEHIKITKK